MFFNIFFTLTSIFILFKTIGYSIYELKEKNNKTGGVYIILLSLFSIIFSNIMFWIN